MTTAPQPFDENADKAPAPYPDNQPETAQKQPQYGPPNTGYPYPQPQQQPQYGPPNTSYPYPQPQQQPQAYDQNGAAQAYAQSGGQPSQHPEYQYPYGQYGQHPHGHFPPQGYYPPPAAPTSVAQAVTVNNVIRGGGPRTQHLVHFIMTLLTGGLWLPVWIIRASINASRRNSM
ncbi:hypothetical protein [Rhodococcus xishaensis]|nr:hypothetical protein [Rhodococcus xishaensis]